MAAPREELSAGAHRSGPSAVTLGVFDGVHRGHLHLLKALRDDAARLELSSAVLTFSNHPLTVLKPELPVVLLTPVAERMELLRASGVDTVIPISFTHELSQWSAEEFVAALIEELSMRHLVVGPDFALGRGREGTADVLAELGARHGFTVRVVEPLEIGGTAARSSSVRASLASGDIAGAAAILSRPYTLSAPIVEGEGRGRSVLGYPTCNLGVSPVLALPADGIYAAWADIDGARLPAAVSVGIKPTFHEDGPRVVEAFVLDFSGDLYGKDVRLEFVTRLREQERFSSADALAAQIARDVEATRSELGAASARVETR